MRTHGHFGFPLGECPQVRPIQGRIWSYAADSIPDHTGTRVSIHMPRWACRLVLEIVSVRVERLQEISEDDAEAEGLSQVCKDGALWKYGIPDRDGLPGTDDDGWPWQKWDIDPRIAYKRLWDSINAKRAPWALNPWVWVVEFRNYSPISKSGQRTTGTPG